MRGLSPPGGPAERTWRSIKLATLRLGKPTSSTQRARSRENYARVRDQTTNSIRKACVAKRLEDGKILRRLVVQ